RRYLSLDCMKQIFNLFKGEMYWKEFQNYTYNYCGHVIVIFDSGVKLIEKLVKQLNNFLETKLTHFTPLELINECEFELEELTIIFNGLSFIISDMDFRINSEIAEFQKFLKHEIFIDEIFGVFIQRLKIEKERNKILKLFKKFPHLLNKFLSTLSEDLKLTLLNDLIIDYLTNNTEDLFFPEKKIDGKYFAIDKLISPIEIDDLKNPPYFISFIKEFL
ncbi:MAG: hypothetical protein ACTSVY_00450, partial [Candidatus Helarchaeota archaeon]